MITLIRCNFASFQEIQSLRVIYSFFLGLSSCNRTLYKFSSNLVLVFLVNLYNTDIVVAIDDFFGLEIIILYIPYHITRFFKWNGVGPCPTVDVYRLG